MSPEQDHFREEEEQEEYASRSIFATGWFRAVLVLTVVAIVVVVALPYLLNWFQPLAPPAKAPSRAAQSVSSPSVSSPAPSPPVARAPVPGRTQPAPAPQFPPAAPQPAPEKARAAAPAPGPTPVAPAAQATPSLPPQMAKAGQPGSRPERGAGASTKPDRAVAENPRSYWVQVGLFKDQKNAEGLARKLRDQEFAVQVAQVTRGETRGAAGALAGGTYYLVRAGAFTDRPRAIAARDALSEKGYPGFLTQGAAK